VFTDKLNAKRKLIFKKFLATKIIKNFFAILSIISLIIFANQFFLVLSQSMTEGLFTSELIPMMLLKLFRDLPFIISLSIVLAVIYSFNGLYKTTELIVLKNAGIADSELIRFILPLIIVFSLFTLFWTIYLMPIIKTEIEILKENARSRPDYIFFKEGTFQNFKEQGITVFSSKIQNLDDSENQNLKNVFIFSDAQKKLILANTGNKLIDKTSENVFLDLFNGKIYEGINSDEDKSISVSEFDILTIKLFDNSSKNLKFELNNAEFKSFVDLLDGKKENIRELLYRISIPISLFLMTLFSVIISKTNPRKQRNFSIAYGLIIYILYFNLLIFFKDIEIFYNYELIINFIIPHLIVILVILYTRNKTLFLR